MPTQRKLAKTAARGYGSKHQAERARYQRRMDAGEQFACSKCGRLVDPIYWDLAHHPLDRSVYLGPQHVRCNRDTRVEKRARRAPTRTVWTSRRW